MDARKRVQDLCDELDSGKAVVRELLTIIGFSEVILGAIDGITDNMRDMSQDEKDELWAAYHKLLRIAWKHDKLPIIRIDE